MARATDGQGYYALRLGLKTGDSKEKKCNHLHLLLKNQKECDEKDMFQKL